MKKKNGEISFSFVQILKHKKKKKHLGKVEERLNVSLGDLKLSQKD